MAARRQKKKKPSGEKKIPWGVLFWLTFVIVLLGLYLINREAINNSIQIVQRVVFNRNIPEEQTPQTPAGPGVIQVPSPTQGSTQPLVEPPTSELASSQPPDTLTEIQDDQPQTPQDTPQTGTVELRDRALHFIQIDSAGSVLLVRANRRLPASDSPLRDVMLALIAGPSAEESQRDLISVIPGGTRLLSVAIRGETAYINFNEEFQYNTYGAEGYKGQLRQVVFTATEFPTVRDVQILIEGNRVDFIGENFWIGSPLSREMF
jgi:spore germination protein GerM